MRYTEPVYLIIDMNVVSDNEDEGNSGIEGDEWDDEDVDQGNVEVGADEWDVKYQRMTHFYVNMPTRDTIDEREYEMRWKIYCRWSACEFGLRKRGPFYVTPFSLIRQRIYALERHLDIEYQENDVPSVFDRIIALEEQLFIRARNHVGMAYNRLKCQNSTLFQERKWGRIQLAPHFLIFIFPQFLCISLIPISTTESYCDICLRSD